MKIHSRIIQYALVVLAMLAAHGAASGQSLYDVVISLSDRQRVVNQKEQVAVYLTNQNNDPGDTDADLPADNPIDWMGAGNNPTQAAVDGLNIGGKIALLNQAVAEFDRLKFEFLNSSPGEFEAGATVGTLRTHTPGVFESLPRATPENYNELLRLLAQRVRALRLIFWRAAFYHKTLIDETDVHEEMVTDVNGNKSVEIRDRAGAVVQSVTWGTPTSIGPGNLVAKTNATFCVSHQIGSSVSCDGSYEQHTTDDQEIPLLREQVLRVSVDYPEKATVSATAQGAEGTQIDGSVYILRRSDWHQIQVSGASSRFDKNQAGYVVEDGKSSGEIPLFSAAPTATFSGTWVKSIDNANSDQIFVEAGYQYKGKSFWHLAFDDPVFFGEWNDSYERNWNVGCTFYSVFKPTFTRGVDATDMRTKLESADGILADNAADGNLLLHPRPSLLFGIDLGPGLKGGGNGCISTKTMEFGWYAGLWDGWYTDYSSQLTMTRFDSSYLLQFAGSCSDYHVVYENNRPNRTQSLPADRMGWPSTDSYAGASYDTSTLYRAWDSPRLKQVVGRDLVANIEYNDSHYGGYTVKIYRRPVGSIAPTPGQATVVTDMELIRNWAFSHPGADTKEHPTDAEKLEVTGSGGETYEIQANEVLPNQGLGQTDHWFGGPSYDWWLWWTEGTHSWTLKLSQGTAVKLKEEVVVNLSTVGYEPTKWDTAMHQSLDDQRVSSLSSTTLNPFKDAFPGDWKITSAGKIITGAATLGALDDPASGYGKWPTSVTIDYDGIQPNASYAWDSQGLLTSSSQGPWSSTGVIDAGAYKQTHKFNAASYATSWSEFIGNKLKTYSAPDGSVTDKTAASVAWSEVEYGTATAGLPGLPHIVKNSDGTGTTCNWQWIAPNNTDQIVLTKGLLSENTVTRGTKQIHATNANGQPTELESYFLNSAALKTGGSVFSDFTAWGMPKKSTDFSTGLASTWNYFQNLSRLDSCTSGLGMVSNFSGYDVLGRPATVSSNGITSTNTYNAFSTTSEITGSATGTLSETRDTFGRLTSSNTTWNNVTDNLTITPGASSDVITRENLLGTHTSTLRKNDGTLATATGPTLAFGGTAGSALTVEDGLLVSKTEITGHPGIYQTTWTDAWGRIRKIETPTASGTGTTDYLYSNPASSVKRVSVTDPTGRKTITETDPSNAAGAITRSGIDKDKDGSLGTSDRYVESITSVSGGNIVTTLKSTEDGGLREILRTEWNPAGNITLTTVNGSEETITRTPNYANKTVQTQARKGTAILWTKTETLNNLGLTTNSSLTGTGIPTASLTPDWRADGSLAGVSFTAGGDTHSATFNNNGTLASLIAPGKGDILGGHSISISGGTETLTVDGVTNITKLDGTEQITSGADIIGKTDTLTLSGSGYKKNTHPALGADTATHFNAAGAPTAKNYAVNAEGEGIPGESYGYAGGLLHTVSLARGGSLTYGYSNDGAKDLTSTVWPIVASGVFTIPAMSESYDYDRAGRIKDLTDESGHRALTYTNGRPWQTTWTTGPLKGYQIIKSYDGGRESGFTLKRAGADIHSNAKTFNGVSREVFDLTSGNVKVVFGRNAARQITGFQWGNASGTFVPVVTQSWDRGTAGRILSASSNVSGAPSFNYKGTANNEASAFDAKGRRLKCATAGGEWAYQYTNGQLTSAIHSTLGTFTYQFDGIGRRTENSANTSDLLNRTLAWTNSQNKTVKVVAHPDARVWFNGTEIPNFSGNYNYSVPSPGTTGGWVPWHTLAVLEGQGDAGAFPDAKAEQSGAVWVPPTVESFTYDAAGNRESSALWNYGWDAKNQLVRSRTKNYNNSTAPQGYDITNAYDAEGRRFSKKVSRYQNGSIVEKKVITFLHDGDDIIYERQQLESGLTTCERKYVWGPDISGTQGGAGGAGGLLLIRETIGGATTDLYPLYDGTGHVVALATIIDSTATLVAEYAYGPFGEPLYAKGPHAQSCPFRYATKYFDIETGLYNFGRRFLDPVTGQWLSREPLGESESANLYAYCHNEPVNKVDRHGLEAQPVEPVLNNGIPAMVYAEWAGNGLGYLWNALAAGKVKTWNQSPSSVQLAINFYQEDGQWHLRSEGARHNAAWELIPSAVSAKMQEIKPAMDFFEKGGAVMAAAPLAVAAGSTEMGAGIYVYGSQALGSFLVQAPLALVGTQAAFEFATDEGVRQDAIGAILSDPNGARATGEFLGAGVSGLARNGNCIWNSMKPAIGEGVEQLLYRSGGLAYAVPPQGGGSVPESLEVQLARLYQDGLKLQGGLQARVAASPHPPVSFPGTTMVDIRGLSPPLGGRIGYDPYKLVDHGAFDWSKYQPIVIEYINGIPNVVNGMTRIENATQSGISLLPAEILRR